MATARTYDALTEGAERTDSLAEIVGLFDGAYCRRCEATFTLDDKTEHRRWHGWLDENQAVGKPVDDELRFYKNHVQPKADYKPDGKVVPLRPPTREELQRHREKFEPKGNGYAQARKVHREACDRVARLYGLTADSLGAMVIELRRDGLGVSEIAEQIGSSEKAVRLLLAG